MTCVLARLEDKKNKGSVPLNREAFFFFFPEKFQDDSDAFYKLIFFFCFHLLEVGEKGNCQWDLILCLCSDILLSISQLKNSILDSYNFTSTSTPSAVCLCHKAYFTHTSWCFRFSDLRAIDRRPHGS